MPNNVSGMAAPVGGLPAIGDGGYLIVSSLVMSPGGVPAPGQTWLLDVVRWRLASGYGEAPFAKGGMMGATSFRRTGYTHVWEAEIVVDLRLQPALILGTVLQTEIFFRLGAPFQAGPIAPWDVRDRYYWAPRCHLSDTSPAVEAGAKLRVRQRVSGVVSGHVFLLPDQGDPEVAGNPAGAYQQWLNNNGT